jgi:hypothetical protein
MSKRSINLLPVVLVPALAFTNVIFCASVIARPLAADNSAWSFITAIPETASDPVPADGAKSVDLNITLSWKAGVGAQSHDVYFGESYDRVNNGTGGTFLGNQTATFFPIGLLVYTYPNGLVPGTTYYWRIDEIDGHEVHKGHVWSFTTFSEIPPTPPLQASDPVPADGAGSIDLNTTLSWKAGFGAKSHDVYFGTNENTVDHADNSNTTGIYRGRQSATRYTPPEGIEFNKTYYWRIDEFDGRELHKGHVWSFKTLSEIPTTAPLQAYDPVPADGATSVDTNVTLSWTPGYRAKLHTVYFGDNFDSVKNAAGGIPQGTTSFNPGSLEPGKTYYWRVDEFDASKTHKGDVWSFTTLSEIPAPDALLDQSNLPPWGGGWTHVNPTSDGRAVMWQTFTPGRPTLIAVDIDILTANPGRGEDILTIEIAGDGDILGSTDSYVPDGFDGLLRCEFPDLILLVPGQLYELRVRDTGKTTFGWRYGPNTYDRGTRYVLSKERAETDWFFQTYSVPALSGSRIIYVDANTAGANDGSSWADAFLRLQDALAAAWYGDKIRVADGIYRPDQGLRQIPGDRDATFRLKNGVDVKGAYAGFGGADPNARNFRDYKTILSGDLNGDDGQNFAKNAENTYHIVKCIECDANTVLDGFTITGGNATADYIAGGMFNYESSPTIKNCTFSANYAGQGGGMANRNSSPTVKNCTFSGNSTMYGGGGMYNTDNSNPTVTGCVFSDSSVRLLGGGGMYNGDSSPMVTNCRFSGNSAMMGGGMYNVGDSTTTVTNCTFTENWASAWGGGIQNEAGAMPNVTNCILWGDIPDEVGFAGSAIITYSDVRGAWAGEGNIARDPEFADPEGRLSSGSPCIDAGSNEAVPSGITKDLDGNPRITNGTVDMGAFEFKQTPLPPPPPDPLAEALDTDLSFTTGGSADWFKQTSTFRYDGDAAQSGDISDDQESWMQTTVTGKGTLKFWWIVSSEAEYDFLEFYIDGSLQEKISGTEEWEGYWQQMAYNINTSGSHVLEWRYMKDSGNDEGSDCGWVDKLEWTP